MPEHPPGEQGEASGAARQPEALFLPDKKTLHSIVKLFGKKPDFFSTFARSNGLVAEWLGRGLQNLAQRFESARDLRGC